MSDRTWFLAECSLAAPSGHTLDVTSVGYWKRMVIVSGFHTYGSAATASTSLSGWCRVGLKRDI